MTEEAQVQCPFCGEEITVVVDCSAPEQNYIEDCFVCCRPIQFHARCEDGTLISITASRE